MPTSAEVRAQLGLALSAIESRLAWGERLGVVFTGVSLGSILLLVALGLAITYVVALAEGADVEPWGLTPEGADASILPVPGLFTDVATLASYAATRSEDLLLQLRGVAAGLHDARLERADVLVDRLPVVAAQCAGEVPRSARGVLEQAETDVLRTGHV